MRVVSLGVRCMVSCPFVQLLCFDVVVLETVTVSVATVMVMIW